MANTTILKVLSICLSLQLVASFPQQSTLKSIEVDEKELQHSKKSNSTGIDLRTSLPPVIASTIDIIQNYSNILLVEQGKFFENLLNELNALPEKNIYIQALILDLSNILRRTNTLDLHNLSATVLNENAAIISVYGEMFGDLSRMALTDKSTSETAMLRQMIYKLDLIGLNKRAKKSLEEAVEKFAVQFEDLWNSMSDAQREEYKGLNEWYASFQAKSDKEKFKVLPEILRSLQGIVIKYI